MRKIIVLMIVMVVSCKNPVSKPPTTTMQKAITTDTVAHTASREIKWDTIKHQSNPFKANSIFLYWEKNYVMANGGISEIFVRLKNYKTKQFLLEAPLDFEDHIDNSDAFYAKLKEQSFEDYNFDGFEDVAVSLRGSMAMTSMTAIYLFNPKTKSFDNYSEELSATNVEVDKKSRTVTATNYDIHSEIAKKYHFDTFGKIKYIEVFSHDNDSTEYKTFEKIVKGKVVKRKVDSTTTE